MCHWARSLKEQAAALSKWFTWDVICGAGLDGQEWQLGPGCFSCSVPGGDLRRRQRSAPGALISASMAKSGSWARGVSAAVFLGEICGAGNGQHQVSASMAKSGSWPGIFLLQSRAFIRSLIFNFRSYRFDGSDLSPDTY